MELLKYQADWVADRSPVKLWHTDRRIGSTWAALHEVVEVARAEDGGPVIVVVQTTADAREVADEISEILGTPPQPHYHPIQEGTRHPIIIEVLGFPKFKAWHRWVTSGVAAGLHLARPALVLFNEAVWSVPVPADVQAKGFASSVVDVLAARFGTAPRVAMVCCGTDHRPWEMICSLASQSGFAVHNTTVDDALADGLGRKICEKAGRDWSEQFYTFDGELGVEVRLS